MRWHVDWLLRLAIEFYLVKLQTYQLQRLGYVQAIYETGARVTHDVKNLLQSLQTLCYAANQPGDPAQVAALLGRQLPQIADRLKATLEKLQSPQIEAPEQRESGLAIWVVFADGCLAVSDNGSAVADAVADALFCQPVKSDDGLGIGLYHAGRQADGAGYTLALTENRPGAVTFSLSQQP